jgi:DNA-directed RNA polymerase specialized sigma24 family protein
VATTPRAGAAHEPDSGDLLLVATGDGAALKRLLARWSQPVYAVFERIREPSAAAEATLQTFERVVHAAGRFDPGESFPAHLWGHAARVAMEQPHVEPAAISASRLAESAAARTALQRSAIAALPSAERTAYLLARVAHLPLPTAAAAIGISEPELRRRLVRALEALRASLRPLLDPTATGAEGPPGIDLHGALDAGGAP